MNKFYPEGCLIHTADNRNSLKSVSALQDSMIQGKILEARAVICDNEHNLIVDLPDAKGIIPREEGAVGISDGSTRDIALISKVNKPVCFRVMNISKDENGQTVAFLSRRSVQQSCIDNYISKLSAGDIIPAKVTHLEQFGCFVDIGCGIPSLIPIDAISVSRISHPSDRFTVGQNINVAVKAVSSEGSQARVWLSHKELLGTWEENASMFHTGETVAGVVRSVEDYGIFIELAPNLAGLAEPRENVYAGQSASVYIKALIPEKMKVKLIIVDVFNSEYTPGNFRYFIKDNHIDYWRYTTDNSEKVIETIFCP
ncbi:MAG TPA: RNA-binding protein [Ruminococcus sp.]|nr:RNA-binding protein [Ruminococcus sp.]HBN11295.1 RNA-binding protein [Ruminococcus sp.]HCR73648.1 RNA-binding protein [Ruminococcus sp.]